jgi:hypothetical protein
VSSDLICRTARTLSLYPAEIISPPHVVPFAEHPTRQLRQAPRGYPRPFNAGHAAKLGRWVRVMGGTILRLSRTIAFHAATLAVDWSAAREEPSRLYRELQGPTSPRTAPRFDLAPCAHGIGRMGVGVCFESGPDCIPDHYRVMASSRFNAASASDSLVRLSRKISQEDVDGVAAEVYSTSVRRLLAGHGFLCQNRGPQSLYPTPTDCSRKLCGSSAQGQLLPCTQG